MTKLLYLGPKPRFQVMFPIPTLSLGAVEETVLFERNQPMELKDRWAAQCLDKMPELFKEVKPVPPTPTKGL